MTQVVLHHLGLDTNCKLNIYSVMYKFSKIMITVTVSEILVMMSLVFWAC